MRAELSGIYENVPGYRDATQFSGIFPENPGWLVGMNITGKSQVGSLPLANNVQHSSSSQAGGNGLLDSRNQAIVGPQLYTLLVRKPKATCVFPFQLTLIFPFQLPVHTYVSLQVHARFSVRGLSRGLARIKFLLHAHGSWFVAVVWLLMSTLRNDYIIRRVRRGCTSREKLATNRAWFDAKVC